MRESGLDAKISKLCARKGCYHQKIAGSAQMRDVPDHIIAYKGFFIALETKAADGRLRPGQRVQLNAIQKRGKAIAELCYESALLERIFNCIDTGGQWQHGDYKPERIGGDL